MILKGTNSVAANIIPPSAVSIFVNTNEILAGADTSFMRDSGITIHARSDTEFDSLYNTQIIKNPKVYDMDELNLKLYDHEVPSETGNPGTKNNTLSAGAIAGICVGVIAFVAVIAILVFIVVKKRKENNSDKVNEV